MSLDKFVNKIKKPVGVTLLTIGSLGILGNMYNIHNTQKQYNSLDNQLGLIEKRETAMDSSFVKDATDYYKNVRAGFGLVALSGAGLLLYKRRKF